MGFILTPTLLLLTYGGAGIVFTAALFRLKSREATCGISNSMIVLMGLASGPMLISLFLFFIFLVLRRPGPAVAIFFVFTGFAAIAVWCRHYLKSSIEQIFLFVMAPLEILKGTSRGVLFICAAVVSIFLYILIQGIGFPIASHDGTVFGCLGRSLYEAGDLSNYIMKTSDPRTGMFLPVSHPPALPLLYVWFHSLQGDWTSSDILQRTVSPIYSIYLALLVATALHQRAGRNSAIFGLFFLLVTPIYVWQSFENSIDPLRLFFIFGAFVFLADLIRSKSILAAVLVSLCCGFSMFIHVTGILCFVAAAVVYLFLNEANAGNRLKTIVIVAIGVLLIGGTQYIRNYRHHGNVLGPVSWNLFNVSTEGFYSDLELSYRGQDGNVGGTFSEGLQSRLESLFDSIEETTSISLHWIKIPNLKLSKSLIFGRLQIFSRPELFGATYFLFSISILWWWRRKEKPTIDIVILFGAVLIALPVIYKFYSNRRYIFTIHPFAIFFCGNFASFLYEKLRQRSLLPVFWSSSVGIVVICILILFLPGSMGAEKVASGGMLRYMLSSRTEQNRMLCPGLFEAIEFVNENGDEDTLVLTSSDARYFYFSEFPGVHWTDPRLRPFYESGTKEEAIDALRSLGVTLILIDYPVGATHYAFTESALAALVQDPDFCREVFAKESKVYEVLPERLPN